MTDLGDREYVLYLRKSKGRAGIARQRRDCMTLLSRIGGRVVGEFIDTDRTAFAKVGSGPARRDDFAAMLDQLRHDRRKLPLGVLAWHADRLDRHVGSADTFVTVCAQGSHPVETARSGSYDLTTPTGRKRFMHDIVDAAYEVDHMIERIEAMKVESAMEGRWFGGRRPFGFEADGTTVRLAEAAELDARGSDLLAGVSLHAIVRDWNGRGITTSTGRAWTTNSVRRVFLRPRNAGLMEHRGEIVGPASWPAVIEETKWRAIVALLSDPSRRTTPGPERRWLGSGIYRCGMCEDQSMRAGTTRQRASGATTAKQRAVYSCRAGKHIMRDAVLLDAYVSKVIVARLSRPDARSLLIEENLPDAALLQSQAIILRQRLQEIAAAFGEGEMTRAQFKTANERAQAELAAIEAEMTPARHAPVLADVVGADDVQEAWDLLDISRRRTVLELLMDVVVHPAPKGRPHGWQPGMHYFDTDSIEIAWKTGA